MKYKLEKFKNIILENNYLLKTSLEQQNLLYFNIRNKSKSGESQQFDTSQNLPGGCDEINNKSNGFYWIKPSCSKNNIKIFCNFAYKNSQSFHIINLTLNKEKKEFISFMKKREKDIDLFKKKSKYFIFKFKVYNSDIIF